MFDVPSVIFAMGTPLFLKNVPDLLKVVGVVPAMPT